MVLIHFFLRGSPGRGRGRVRAVGAPRPWHTPWHTGRGLWGPQSGAMAPTSHLCGSEVSFAALTSIPFPRRCVGPVSSLPFPPSQPSPCASCTLGGFFFHRLSRRTRAGRQQELPQKPWGPAQELGPLGTPCYVSVRIKI